MFLLKNVTLFQSQKTYELQLNKYFVSDFDNKKWINLKQDLENGKDSFTFLKPANASAGIVVRKEFHFANY